ncbi:MAG: CGGC domain-containing protein [Christensenellales bacterium]|jgi:predicted metal-binding protein
MKITKEAILSRMGENRERVEQALARTAPVTPIKRIAIIVCGNVAANCPASACLWAFREQERYFEQYKGEKIPLKLFAFFPCNGCDTDFANDLGMRKKLERLVLEEVDKVHLASCIKSKCPHIQTICAELEKYDLKYEVGTH